MNIKFKKEWYITLPLLFTPNFKKKAIYINMYRIELDVLILSYVDLPILKTPNMIHDCGMFAVAEITAEFY